MRRILTPLLLATITFAACSGEPTPEQQPTRPSLSQPSQVEVPTDTDAATVAPDSGMVTLHSLTGSGLKFHGVYDAPTPGNVHYFIRFFERGNAALVAGRQEPSDPVDLRSLLIPNAQSGSNNVHNVPVTRRGDSLFFSTMANRGAITYSGVVDGDSLRFLKQSKATGKSGMVVYGFVPDGVGAR